MELLKNFNIDTNNQELYLRALTHTSFANEHKETSYERLEFLGDAVLELVISEYLYNNKNLSEGEMTKLRSHYVCENANYEYSISLNLNEYLRLGHGEEESGGRYRKAIVADIFEAFIGAMFLDKGFTFVRNFIYEKIIPIIENSDTDFFDDYKSLLQELVQTEKRSLVYEVINEEGPAHNKTFTILVKINDVVYGKGVAHSKRDAEQLAAKDALSKAQKA